MRLARLREEPGCSRMSAGGFNAEAGLALRDRSMGDDFGLSESSSICALFPSRIGGVLISDSLDGDELSVSIRSLSRNPRMPSDSSTSP